VSAFRRRASESLDDAPHRPRLPSYPAKSGHDLYGSLSLILGISRALDTAVLLQTSLGCKLEVIDELAECSWGSREGEVKGQWFEDWKAGNKIPDGAEPYEQFLERALRGINKSLERPGPVLIVSHGGVYWSVQKYAALGSEFDIANAIPVRHDPPRRDYPWWTATIIEMATSAIYVGVGADGD
jgi:probable phosphoglycerate mutase